MVSGVTNLTMGYTTANGYHLLVVDSSNNIVFRSPSAVDKVPEYSQKDIIIAVVTYKGASTDPDFQYLTFKKAENSVSIAQNTGGSTYTEEGKITAPSGSAGQGIDIVTSTTNSDIRITPNGSGKIVLDGLNWPIADGSSDQVLKTNGSGQLSFTTISSNSITDADGDTKIQVEESSDEDKIRFDTAGTERMIIDETGKVGIGTSSPSELLHLSDADASEPTILIENTGTNASEPELVFYRSTATGADSRDIGHVKFKARDTAGNIHTFAHFFADSEDADTTTEDGKVDFLCNSSRNGWSRNVKIKR